MATAPPQRTPEPGIVTEFAPVHRPDQQHAAIGPPGRRHNPVRRVVASIVSALRG